jgi:hypothetical protein
MATEAVVRPLTVASRYIDSRSINQLFGPRKYPAHGPTRSTSEKWIKVVSSIKEFPRKTRQPTDSGFEPFATEIFSPTTLTAARI